MEYLEKDDTEETSIANVFLDVTQKAYEITAVVQIQRCWRSYLDKLTFKHIRNLIHKYEQVDPKSLLLRINRSEAPLVDKATGLHMRFRLSGMSFPPMVVYKVYTHRPVVDMGSFSPREYSAKKEHLAAQTTYIRWENNGWRPVVGTPAEQTGPRVVLQDPDFGGFFANSPEERRLLKLMALKNRKRAWLRKLKLVIIMAGTTTVVLLKFAKPLRMTLVLNLSARQNWNGKIWSLSDGVQILILRTMNVTGTVGQLLFLNGMIKTGTNWERVFLGMIYQLIRCLW